MDKLSDKHQERINALKNLIRGFSITKDWLTTHIDSIVEFIEKRYKKPSSRSSYFSSVRSLAEALGLDAEIIERLSQLSTKYIQKYVDFKEKNKLSESEEKNIHSFVCYSSKREELLKKWLNKKDDLTLMYKMLIMSLLTLEPPKRTSDYLDIKLIDKLPKNPVEDNFLLVEDNGNCTLYLNKPAKRKKGEKTPMPPPFKLNEILSKIIILTLKEVPRKYLLADKRDNNSPMTISQFNHLTDHIYLHEHVRLNFVRTSYVAFVKKQQYDAGIQTIIATRMLHSLLISITHYNKLKVINDNCKLIGIPIIVFESGKYPIVLFKEKSKKIKSEPKEEIKPSKQPTGKLSIKVTKKSHEPEVEIKPTKQSIRNLATTATANAEKHYKLGTGQLVEDSEPEVESQAN